MEPESALVIHMEPESVCSSDSYGARVCAVVIHMEPESVH